MLFLLHHFVPPLRFFFSYTILFLFRQSLLFLHDCLLLSYRRAPPFFLSVQFEDFMDTQSAEVLKHRLFRLQRFCISDSNVDHVSTPARPSTHTSSHATTHPPTQRLAHPSSRLIKQATNPAVAFEENSEVPYLSFMSEPLSK